jgi:hypothetical protein
MFTSAMKKKESPQFLIVGDQDFLLASFVNRMVRFEQANRTNASKAAVSVSSP